MIELRDISKSFPDRDLFSDVAFTINADEKIGLVGRNGHGKSTLFGLLNGSLHPDTGTISIPKNYRIGWLKQIIAFTKNTVLGEACLGLPKEESESSWKAEKVLQGLGFSVEDMQRSPLDFSGGFQVRINLAKILISETNLLLLDEPNNYLDVVAIRWLIRFLRQWRGELMLITHDRHFMDAVVTHIVGIHRKKVHKITGNTQRFYEQIAQVELIYEKTRVRDERKRRDTEIFIAKFRAKARQAGLAQSRRKTLEKQEVKEKLEAVESLKLSFTSAGFKAPIMLTIENLGFAYNRSGPNLINNLSFSVGRRERICVIGKNGKGKSTLLRLLAGELTSVTGTIKAHPKLAVGYYAQTNVAKLNGENTVFSEIMSANPKAVPQRGRAICGALLFSQDLALKPISVLSGGEKNRVLLGKIMMHPCNLLLLDEPTSHLDMESTEALLESIDEFEGSVIMVTHNERFLERIARRILVFDEQGVKRLDGTYEDFLNKIGWQDEAGSLKTEQINNRTAKITRQTRKMLTAQLRQERYNILDPIEKKIQKLEASITKTEAQLKNITEELITASYESDAQAIAKLAKQNKELTVSIEEQYEQLDILTQEYEAQAEIFAKKLTEIEKTDV